MSSLSTCLFVVCPFHGRLTGGVSLCIYLLLFVVCHFHGRLTTGVYVLICCLFLLRSVDGSSLSAYLFVVCLFYGRLTGVGSLRIYLLLVFFTVG